MSQFLTPRKARPGQPPKSTTHSKPEDWVCALCHNLNFSFRKKCNRCKTQTRLSNNNYVASAYSHYYYEIGAQGQLAGDKQSPLSDCTNLHTPQPPRHSGPPRQPEPEGNLARLAKQYCPKDLDTRTASIRRECFANQFWDNIEIHDFEDVLAGEQAVGDQSVGAEEPAGGSGEGIEAELERMFDRILLQ